MEAVIIALIPGYFKYLVNQRKPPATLTVDDWNKETVRVNGGKLSKAYRKCIEAITIDTLRFLYRDTIQILFIKKHLDTMRYMKIVSRYSIYRYIIDTFTSLLVAPLEKTIDLH